MKRFYVIMLASIFVFATLAPMGSAFGAEQPGNHRITGVKPGYTDTIPGFNETGLFTKPWLPAATDIWSDDPEQSWFLAEAEKEPEGEEKPLSPECMEWRKDPDADLGKVLRAGCEPTLAQMSRLMDNPLGNVAMWFNQFDAYVLNNQEFRDEERVQWNYMGILQFPKGISENWNIINRIVYNVTSAPVDQRKVDDLFDGDYGNYEGQPLPPSNTDVAPIDKISGRTTGLGDTFYVGLLSPKKGIKHEGGGSSVWGLGIDAAFPTATDDVLGSGKWSAGPSALYAYLDRSGKSAVWCSNTGTTPVMMIAQMST